MLTRLFALVAVLLPLAIPVGPGLAASGCPPRSVSVSDAAVVEGSAAAGGILTFTVTSTGCAAGSIQYSTVAGAVAGLPAALAGIDYVSIGGGVAWAVGDISPRTVSVPVIGDSGIEPDEVLTLSLHTPAGLTMADPVGVGRILNDDVEIAIGKPHCDEICVVCPLRVFTSSPVPTDVTYQVATRPGTATAGSDYAPIHDAVLTIPAGASTATIAVAIHDDRLAEADEDFFVVILGRTTDELARARITIIDDD